MSYTILQTIFFLLQLHILQHVEVLWHDLALAPLGSALFPDVTVYPLPRRLSPPKKQDCCQISGQPNYQLRLFKLTPANISNGD